jgi:hypothetical protein
VAGVTGGAVVVDVDGGPGLTGVLEHEVAVGVVVAGTTGADAGVVMVPSPLSTILWSLKLTANRR